MRTYLRERLTVAAWGVGAALVLTHLLIDTFYNRQLEPLLHLLDPQAPPPGPPDWPWLLLTGLGFCSLGQWWWIQLARIWQLRHELYRQIDRVRHEATKLLGADRAWQLERWMTDYLLLPDHDPQQPKAKANVLTALAETGRAGEREAWQGWHGMFMVVHMGQWMRLQDRLDQPSKPDLLDEADDNPALLELNDSEQRKQAMEALQRLKQRMLPLKEAYEKSHYYVMDRRLRQLTKLLRASA